MGSSRPKHPLGAMSYQKVGDSSSGGDAYGAAEAGQTEGFGSARSQVGTTYGGSDSNWVKENQNTILAIVGGVLFVSGIYMMWPAAAPSDYDANSIDARLGNIPGYDPSRTSQDLDSSDEEGEAPTSFIANIPKKDSQVPAAPPAQFVESTKVSSADAKGMSTARKSMVVQAVLSWLAQSENDSACKKVVQLLSQCSAKEVLELMTTSGLPKDGAAVLKRYSEDRTEYLASNKPLLRKLLTTKQNNRLQHKINVMLTGQRSDLYVVSAAQFPSYPTILNQMIDTRVSDTKSYQGTITQEISNSGSSDSLNRMSLNQMLEVSSLVTSSGDSFVGVTNVAAGIQGAIDRRVDATQQQLRPISLFMKDKGILPGNIKETTSEMLQDFMALLRVKKEINKLKLDLAIQQHKPGNTVKTISGWLDAVDDCNNAIIAYMDRRPVPKTDIYNSPATAQRISNYNSQQQQQQQQQQRPSRDDDNSKYVSNSDYMNSRSFSPGGSNSAPPPPPPPALRFDDNSRFVSSDPHPITVADQQQNMVHAGSELGPAPPPPPAPNDNSRFLHTDPHPVTRQAECVNKDVSCPQWAEKGECEKNTAYMQNMCCRACTEKQEKDKESSGGGGFFGGR